MGGSEPSGVAYVYAPDRKGRAADYPPCRASKVLQVDVYGSRRMLAERADMHLAFYLSHVPAASTKSLSAGPALIASEALKRIAGPCAIESDAIGRCREAACCPPGQELGDHCVPSSS